MGHGCFQLTMFQHRAGQASATLDAIVVCAVPQVYSSLVLSKLQNHEIIEWLRLEGITKVTELQPLAMDRAANQ